MLYSLEELFDLQMGKTPSRNNLNYWNTKDNKWISIGDLSQSRKYIQETKEYISDSAVKESGIKIIPANTVIMSFKLSIGKVAITKENIYSNEAIMAFHDKHVTELLPEYIYYLFMYKDWSAGTNKAVMGKTLNKTTLSQMKIDVCSIQKQREIVDVLNKVFQIFDNVKEQVYALDNLIKSRFVEMFGDPVTNSKQWKIKNFEEISIFITDGEHTTPQRIAEGIYLLSARNVLNHTIQLKNVDFIGEEEYERIAKRVVPMEGDILISCSGSIGRCCVVPKDLKFQMVRSIALIRFNDEINPIFAEWLISSDDLQQQIKQASTQSSQANLFQSKIKKLHGYIPPLELQQQFATFVHQVDKLKVIKEKYSKKG